MLSALLLTTLLLPGVPRQCSLLAQNARPTTLALLPDGWLLVARQDGRLVLVDPGTGQSPEAGGVFAAHPAAVQGLSVDPRGEIVAASSGDGRIALWELRKDQSGRIQPPGPYAEPGAFVTPYPDRWRGGSGAHWSHDGGHFLTYRGVTRPDDAPTRPVKLWSRAGRHLWTGPPARAIAMSPTEDLMALLLVDELWLGWPGGDTIRIPVEGATDLAFSRDGARLAVGGMSVQLWVLDVESRRILLDRVIDVGDPMQDMRFPGCMTWSPDGRWLGMMLVKGTLPVVVAPTSGRTVWSGGFLGGRMWSVYPVAWTPDNRLVYGWEETFVVEPESGSSRPIAQDERHQFIALGEEALVFLTREGLERIDLPSLRRRWRR